MRRFLPHTLIVLTMVAGLSWLAVAPSTAAEDENAPKPERKLTRFMRAKLASTELVLEGLVVEDFDKIEKGAVQLQVIAAAEEWRVSEDPLYAHHSEEFRRIAKGLRKQANDKNLEGAALSYLELTMSCIECHRFVRNVLVTDRQLPQVDRVLIAQLGRVHQGD